ncbi:MAG: HAMP domain-containing sensor histidine kinase, partial [Curvibacter sp.]
THEQEIDRMKSDFLSTAAHELRTPMASIYGFSELLLSARLPEANRQEALNAIHRQSKLMISIVNELLDLARIDARRGQDFDFQRVALNDVVREACANFQAPDGRPAPQHAPNPTALHVTADRLKLLQAIGNVLSNAYKYSPDGGDVSLAVVTEPADSAEPARVGIRVTDQGLGMTPEQLARVSERFYRADNSGRIPGTGLGMSIVKEIITLHGGEVALASEYGVGTTVTLWLPAARTSAAPA